MDEPNVAALMFQIRDLVSTDPLFPQLRDSDRWDTICDAMDAVDIWTGKTSIETDHRRASINELRAAFGLEPTDWSSEAWSDDAEVAALEAVRAELRKLAD